MNIDVREYLRINPISAHDLTLSEDGKDCFLIFMKGVDEEEYPEGCKAITQNKMFAQLVKRIFGNLVRQDGTRLNLDENGEWKNDANISENQFNKYARMETYGGFYGEVDQQIGEIESELDSKIKDLGKNAKLWYKGAVEYQSQLNPGFYDGEDNFDNLIGITWCYNPMSPQAIGYDEVFMSEPIKHQHVPSSCQTTTFPYSTKKGGGQLVGYCGIGNKDLVSSDNWGETSTSLFPIDVSDSAITQPLYGRNVLNWRDRKQSHNNIPPATNILIRRAKEDDRTILDAIARKSSTSFVFSTETTSRNGGSKVRTSFGIDDFDDKPISYVEAQHFSSAVSELPDYVQENLTSRDCILRMSSSDGQTADGGIKLMRQTIRNLLDIFADKTFKNLSTPEHPMDKMLEKKLDECLVPRNKYMSWHNGTLDKIKELQGKLDILRQMLSSMKPVTYVGRIILSTKDDTEQKVIRNYGGRKWRRLTNFLRGTNPGLETEGKLGEEFVCLRESNIPIHAHNMKVETTQNDTQYVKLNQGGKDARVVNVGGSGGEEDVDETFKLENVTVNHQVSPLEYDQKSIILPHDNMPPYREVYMWECIDSGEDDETCEVIWHSNCEVEDPEPQEYPIGEKIGETPQLERTGYVLQGWRDRLGHEVTEETIISRTLHCYATWEPKTCTVTFNFNIDGRQPQYKQVTYGEPIGQPPQMYENQGYIFNRWIDANGNTIYLDSPCYSENLKIQAIWTPSQHVVVFDPMDGTFRGQDRDAVVVERNISHGEEVGNLPTVERTGFNFLGWYPESTDQEINADTIIQSDSTFFARWEAIEYNISYNMNGHGNEPDNVRTKYTILLDEYTPPKLDNLPGYLFVGWEPPTKKITPPLSDIVFTANWQEHGMIVRFDTNGGDDTIDNREVAYGEPIGELPTATRRGYDLDGWYLENGDEVQDDFVVEENLTLYAKWIVHNYTISYNMGGHGDVPENVLEEYNIEMPTRYQPPVPEIPVGYSFEGWSPKYIEPRSVGDVEFKAIWRAISYNITWNTGGHGELPSDVPYTYTVEDEIVPPHLEEDRYQLNGWEPPRIEVGSTGDKTMVASWSEVQTTWHLVEWDANGGDQVSETSRQVEHGKPVGELPTASKEGFILGGWVDSHGDFITERTKILDDATFHATWVAQDNTTTITFRDNIPVTITYESNKED